MNHATPHPTHVARIMEETGMAQMQAYRRAQLEIAAVRRQPSRPSWA